MTKQEIRSDMLNRRLHFKPSDRRQLDKKIKKHLVRLIQTRACNQAFIYYPIQAEPDLLDLPSHLSKRRITWALPVMLPGRQLGFSRWTGRQQLVEGPAGIKQIIPSQRDYLEPTRQTLFVFSGLAATISGYRLGYGGGYVDRYLAAYPFIQSVLVVYQQFVIDSIPIQTHDQTFNFICTELGVKLKS